MICLHYYNIQHVLYSKPDITLNILILFLNPTLKENFSAENGKH